VSHSEGGPRGGARAPRPLPDSYWVEPGRFAAGEYPGHPLPREIPRQLEKLARAGVNFLVDLTEAGEYGLEPYAPHLPAEVQHCRMSIRDMHVPTRQEMRAILDLIDGALAAGKTVYLHCFGGIGRTGTVVGCWLVRHGTPPEEALARIARWRRGTPDASRSSPETPAQREFVRCWQEGE
jgi:protein-tyrosine phosphatase